MLLENLLFSLSNDKMLIDLCSQHLKENSSIYWTRKVGTECWTGVLTSTSKRKVMERFGHDWLGRKSITPGSKLILIKLLMKMNLRKTIRFVHNVFIWGKSFNKQIILVVLIYPGIWWSIDGHFKYEGKNLISISTTGYLGYMLFHTLKLKAVHAL